MRLLPLLLALVVGCAARCAEAPPRPNLLLILADDLGYGDLHCYNPDRGRIPTPHLDRLAAQGLRFTDAHASSGVCSPSRYTLLTGRYHWRTRLQSGIVESYGAPLIASHRLTVAGLARQHGYRTGAIGKWHLGWDWPFTPAQRPLLSGPGPATEVHRAAWRDVFAQRLAGGPTACGFASYFGTDVPNWPPYCFIENDRTVGIPVEFLPDRLLNRNQFASLPGPALKDWQLEGILPALGDRAEQFIARGGPQPWLLYLALTTPHTPLAVNPAWQGRSGLSNACADLIMETDALVGRVLQALDRSGAATNTLVLFTSDNGFAEYVGARQLEAQGHFPSGPLRGYKASVYEGGHRVPFLVRWPGVVAPGRVCPQLVHHADLLATVADLLQVTLPADAGEDSFSLLPLLQGGDRPVRPHAVSCAMSGVPGLRQGPWKLILGPDSGPRTIPRLYHLASDLGERRDLSAQEPERVRQMLALYEKLIADGRSTPGPRQRNDVKVIRHPATARTPPATGEVP